MWDVVPAIDYQQPQKGMPSGANSAAKVTFKETFKVRGHAFYRGSIGYVNKRLLVSLSGLSC